MQKDNALAVLIYTVCVFIDLLLRDVRLENNNIFARPFVSLVPPRSLNLRAYNRLPVMSGKYIVVFKPNVTKEQIDEYANSVDKNGGQVTHRYDSVLNGFAAELSETSLSQLQSLDDVIDYIEPDGVVTTQ